MDRLDFLAAISTLSGLIALGAAVFVYRTAPDPRVAWRFGGLLALEAIMVWTNPTGRSVGSIPRVSIGSGSACTS